MKNIQDFINESQDITINLEVGEFKMLLEALAEFYNHSNENWRGLDLVEDLYKKVYDAGKSKLSYQHKSVYGDGIIQKYRSTF